MRGRLDEHRRITTAADLAVSENTPGVAAQVQTSALHPLHRGAQALRLRSVLKPDPIAAYRGHCAVLDEHPARTGHVQPHVVGVVQVAGAQRALGLRGDLETPATDLAAF